MLTIRLFCNQGMSTSILIEKMLEAAREENLEVDICAYGEVELPNRIDGVDVALLGPQVTYRLDTYKPVCQEKGVALAAIPMRDYGMMDGKRVLELSKELAARKS